MDFVPAKDQLKIWLFSILQRPKDFHLPVAAQCAVLNRIGCEFVDRNPDLNDPIRWQWDIRTFYGHATVHVERKSVSSDQVVQRKYSTQSVKNKFLRTRISKQPFLETAQAVARIDSLARDCVHERQRVSQLMCQLVVQKFRFLLSLLAVGDVFGNTHKSNDLTVGI